MPWGQKDLGSYPSSAMAAYISVVGWLVCELVIMIVLYLKGYCEDAVRSFHIGCIT